MDEKKIATPRRPEGEGSKEMLLRMNDSHQPLREWAFRFIDWKPEMQILDVGCGGGATIADMLQLSEGSRIDGIDYSPDSVAASREWNAKELGKRVFIYEGDVSVLPFEEQSYDLVTGVETVYFWPDLAGALRKIRRVLKKDGILAILCEIDCPEKAAAWGDIHCELTVYRPEELAYAMADAGFTATDYEVKSNGYTVVFGTR